MPQLDPNWFAPQLFWLAVSFLVLYLLLSRVALPRVAEVLEERRTRIEHDLDRAQRLKDEADAIRAELDRALVAAREEARQILKAAADTAQADAKAQSDATSRALQARTREAEARIAQAREATVQSLRQSASGLAADIAERLTGTRPSDSAAASAVAGASGRGR
jgi:F-type H+-transporting ATPase subunit b